MVRTLSQSFTPDASTPLQRYPDGIEEFYSLYEWLVDTLEDPEETELRNEVQPAFFHPQ